MNILITGGAGFLGSHLCRFFLEKGHRVACMDNLKTGSVENVREFLSRPKFSFIQYDVTNEIHYPGKLDAVLHFASPASPVDYLKFPIQTLKVGSLGTHKTLGLAREKRAIFMLASTSEVYGDPLVNPQKEDYWGNVNPVGPRGVYDEAKRFAEAMTIAYHRYHKMPVRILRIFNTYGPQMRLDDGRAIPNFITQALKHKPITVYGKGTQTRSLCYVDDLVAGINKLLLSNVNHPVNIGNPEEIQLIDLAEQIKILTKSRSKIAFKALPVDDPQVRCPDITRAREELGWAPKVTLKAGLAKTVPYFRQALKKEGKI